MCRGHQIVLQQKHQKLQLSVRDSVEKVSKPSEKCKWARKGSSRARLSRRSRSGNTPQASIHLETTPEANKNKT